MPLNIVPILTPENAYIHSNLFNRLGADLVKDSQLITVIDNEPKIFGNIELPKPYHPLGKYEVKQFEDIAKKVQFDKLEGYVIGITDVPLYSIDELGYSESFYGVELETANAVIVSAGMLKYNYELVYKGSKSMLGHFKKLHLVENHSSKNCLMITSNDLRDRGFKYCDNCMKRLLV